MHDNVRLERQPFVLPGLRFKAFLSAAKQDGSCLVAARGAGGRSLHVLRFIGAPDSLRADLLDLACLEHPRLSLPRRFGTTPGAGIFALRDYIDGTDILTAARGRSPRETVAWLGEAAGALAVLHRHGFVHGSVKGTNLIVPHRALRRRSSRGFRIVLCDPAWSLPAKSSPDADNEAMLRAGPFARDLLALGELFYRVLAGVAPERRRDGFPPAPSKASPDIPVDLDRIVLKLLSSGASPGYASAEELCIDLERVHGDCAGSPSPAADSTGDWLQGSSPLVSPASVSGHEEPAEMPAILAIRGESARASRCVHRLVLERQLLGVATLQTRSFPNAADPLLPLIDLARQTALAGARPSELERLLALGVDPDPDPASRGRFLRGLIEAFLRDTAGTAATVVAEDVHHAGPLFIDFLADMVKVNRERETIAGEEAAGPPRLVLSYRPESPFLAALKPLLAAIERAGGGSTVDLDAEFPTAGRGPVTASLVERYSIHFSALSPLQQRLLQVVSIVGEPICMDLLLAVLGTARSAFEAALQRLIDDGTLRRDHGQVSFRHGSLQSWIFDSLESAGRQALHRIVACELEKTRAAGVEAIAHHWLASDEPARGLAAALKAARSLTRRHEDRRAVIHYRRLLELLPGRAGKSRRQVAEEAARVLIRTGEHAGAVRLLRHTLDEARSRAERSRFHEMIGLSYHLQGDARQAAHELEASLAQLPGQTARAAGERLRIRCLLADIAIGQGRYARAEELVGDAGALVKARRSRTGKAVRPPSTLLATLGNLRLRQFRFDEARELLEASLAGGRRRPTAERSLIWNNLGVLHAQEDRIEDAIHCYQEARDISATLGQDSMLLTIEANLSVLHAKRGDATAADAAARRALAHDSLWGSARTRFLRHHAAGVMSLLLGRYAAAIESLRAAIDLGSEIKDLHMLAFDLIYLAECHLHRGELKAGVAALDRAGGLEPLPSPIRPMAAARRALSAALRGEKIPAGILEAALATTGVRYLDAGNRLCLGWALRLRRDGRAREQLEAAKAFFSLAQLPPAEIHAELELTALDLDQELRSPARARLGDLERRFRCGFGPLANPMLAARLLTLKARLLLAECGSLPQVVSTLVEAESYLIGRRLRDLENTVRGLRRRVEDARVEVQELDGASRLSLPAPVRRPPLAARETETDAIDGRSRAAMRLRDSIRKLADSSLPVLITGETGSGKDLAARLLHRQSSRAAGPFVTVNCAALPEALLEAELFGHAAGAFSGAEGPSAGLLAGAQGGTFLFDEIGELPLGLQAKLLHVLDRRRVRPVGSVEELTLDVRCLFSTNRDLGALVQERLFRTDLFYRLNALELRVPPLRERLEDLPLLVERFRLELGAQPASTVIPPAVLSALQAHSWPGNLRELKNVFTRLDLLPAGGATAAAVQEILGSTKPGEPLAAAIDAVMANPLLRRRSLKELQDELERQYLLRLQREHGGEVRAMAAALGITRRAVYKRLRRLGLGERPRG